MRARLVSTARDVETRRGFVRRMSDDRRKRSTKYIEQRQVSTIWRISCHNESCLRVNCRCSITGKFLVSSLHIFSDGVGQIYCRGRLIQSNFTDLPFIRSLMTAHSTHRTCFCILLHSSQHGNFPLFALLILYFSAASSRMPKRRSSGTRMSLHNAKWLSDSRCKRFRSNHTPVVYR